ncbi:hypothetical protein B0H19DRAFT_1239236 [Mycena capillaripes]|nr:hypothetical protein B0H19DRAFT_1239236 [Mycena capillaripes]
MLDPVYLTLIACLILSNLTRIIRILTRLFTYFSRARGPHLVPYFDADGELIGLVRLRPESRNPRSSHLRAGGIDKPEAMPSEMPESSLRSPHSRAIIIDNPAGMSAEILMRKDSTDSHLKTLSMTKATDEPEYIPQISFSWDFWPDGKFQFDVSPQQLVETNKLASNWVSETVRSRGSSRALTWKKGHELRRKCLGVIECHSKGCRMQLAPALRAIDRYTQLRQTCPICVETLTLRPCGIESFLFRFRDGAVFIHNGTHNHSEFSHASVQHPNGSLGFVDYVPKHSAHLSLNLTSSLANMSSDVSATNSDDEPTASWHGIGGDFNDSNSGQSANVAHESGGEGDGGSQMGFEDEETDWEIRRDPLAAEGILRRILGGRFRTQAHEDIQICRKDELDELPPTASPLRDNMGSIVAFVSQQKSSYNTVHDVQRQIGPERSAPHAERRSRRRDPYPRPTQPAKTPKLRSPFMASRLIKSMPTDDNDAIGGLVSDAAHRYWRIGNSLLIITSTYEPVHLKCWVPVLITYSNGGTAEHYRIHFFELFWSFAEQADKRRVAVTDEMLANVVDFSQAERNGFILAFIDFWRRREPDGRTVAELREIAPTLLKGCEQHFRNQITRVKKISGVVDPSQTDVFENYAKRLLKCNSVEEFTSTANEFIGTFPKAETWIRWWMLPEHACMLFPSFRIMSTELWNSIPKTTNAEEAMHWKLYAALGRFLSLLEGLKALVAFAEYYRLQFEAQRHGIRTQYGADREPWKTTGNLHGRTHFSRTPGARRTGAKSDGRPPDTGKALLGRRNLKPKAPEFEKGYKWKDNSCWLDSSLTAIFSAASRDFDKSMDPIFSALPQGHPLLLLLQMIHTRHSLELAGYEEGGCSVLSNQRDGFRMSLRDLPKSPVKSLSNFGSLFGWLYHLANVPPRKDSAPAAVERAISYFRVSSVLLRSCSGLCADHFQLERIKWREQVQLTDALCHEYNGDMRKWFLDSIRPSKPRPALSCWRAHDGDIFCDGDAISYEVILSIPIVLIIEISVTSNGRYWNIPKGLAVYANNPTAVARKVHYSIASHLYSDTQQNHFIARYSSDMVHVYDYDGRQRDGNAVLNPAKLKSITGPTDLLPGIPAGYRLHAVVYHLDGGQPAQDYFRQEQIRLAGIKPGLHFGTNSTKTGIPVSCELRRPNLEIVSDKDRSLWVPTGSSAIDYIIPQKSPRKSQASVPRIHRQRSIMSISSSDENSWHPPMAPISRFGHRVKAQAKSPSDHHNFAILAAEEFCGHKPIRPETPERDSQFFPGFIRMLPAIQDWLNETVWMPAAFIDFNTSRPGREYQFEWIPSIVWAEGTEPDNLTFYRSIVHWEKIEDVERLRDDQVCAINIPLSFAKVFENSPILDDELAWLFDLAVPAIAQILAAMDPSNPVIQSYQDRFADGPFDTRESMTWMRQCFLEPTPALEAMLEEPLAALAIHPLLRNDPFAHRKIWGAGSVLFQLLAIQHSLGIPLDLNGHTFSELQNGDLTLEPPRAVAALEAMWSSIDPIAVAAENGWSSPQLAEYEDMFTAKHSVYFSPCDITFYVSLGFMASKRAPIRIQHNGRDILFAHQLPSDARPEKRRFEEVDSGDQLEDDFDPPRPEPKRSRKWLPKATPPGCTLHYRLFMAQLVVQAS